MCPALALVAPVAPSSVPHWQWSQCHPAVPSGSLLPSATCPHVSSSAEWSPGPDMFRLSASQENISVVKTLSAGKIKLLPELLRRNNFLFTRKYWKFCCFVCGRIYTQVPFFSSFHNFVRSSRVFSETCFAISCAEFFSVRSSGRRRARLTKSRYSRPKLSALIRRSDM